MKEISRKVKKRRAKDYTRDAKYYDWLYIVYKKTEIGLNLNGWTGFADVHTDRKGKFIYVYPNISDGNFSNAIKCYLDLD